MTEAERHFRAGAMWAIENAEITEHDGWHKHDPRIDTTLMEKELEKHISSLKEKGHMPLPR